MARTYIKPNAAMPFPDPQSEREELNNILWSIGVSIPYSKAIDPHHMFYVELSELRDLTQWQMDKVANEPEFQKGHITEEAQEGFRQYLRWRDRRDMGVVSYSVPGIPNA
jgi:hypothetical protein